MEKILQKINIKITMNKNYFKIGLSGIIGGFGLGIAMITFIWSITNTTAAIIKSTNNINLII